MGYFDFAEDCRMGLINFGGRHRPVARPTAAPTEFTEWPKCAVHGVQGHMVDSPACVRMTAKERAHEKPGNT